MEEEQEEEEEVEVEDEVGRFRKESIAVYEGGE